MRSRFMWACLVTSGLGAASGSAQAPEAESAPADKLFVVDRFAPMPAFGAQIDIVGSEGGVPGAIVKGKPYSARSITESTQVLADGNRITQRNEAVIHRDSDGRTRREQTLRDFGPWQTNAPVTVINIHDPVSGKSYVLDPDARTAREMRPLQMAFAPAQAVTQVVQGTAGVRAVVPAPAPTVAPAPGTPDTSITVVQRAESGVQVFSAQRFGIAMTAPFPDGTSGAHAPAEELGEQVLEGLLVRGTRTTDTIPAGVIGNERPIEIVTERWFSEDIDAIVLHRFSDPRFGETLYRLVNVVRGEPSRDLFEVPQGYELQVSPGPVMAPRAPRPMPGQPVELTLRREPPPAQ